MEGKQEVVLLALTQKTVASLFVALAQAGAYCEVRGMDSIASRYDEATKELVEAFGQTLVDEIAMRS